MATSDGDSPLFDEPLVPLKATREYGCNAHPRTAWKWVAHGTRSRINGMVHKLEAVFQGSVLFTSRAAYRRFLIALNREPDGPKPKRKRPRSRK